MKRAAWLLLSIPLSGVLLALALPPHFFSPLGWLCFVPVILASRRLGFAAGFASGLSACLLAAWFDARGFLLTPSLPEGSPGWTYTAFALFGLIAGLAIGVSSVAKRLEAKAWALAAWAVLFEALTLVYLPAHMALTQSRSTVMLFLASIGGIWLVSYGVWLANFSLARLIETKRFAHAIPTAIAFSALSLSFLPSEKGSYKIAMVQTASGEADVLTEWNTKAGALNAKLAVWPELSGQVMAPSGDAKDLTALGKRPRQAAFVTSYPEEQDGSLYNVARVFSNGGASAGYRKRKPFAGEAQMHKAGKEAIAVDIDGVKLGLNICFDSCFPAIMRDTARLPGVQAILLPTLDPDTPYGIIQSIHAAYTPFRAAELGLPIVRSDITGYSMAVDANGRIVKEIPSVGETLVNADIRPGKRWTLVTMLGDWFLVIAGLLALLGFRGSKPTEETVQQEIKEEDAEGHPLQELTYR